MVEAQSPTQALNGVGQNVPLLALNWKSFPSFEPTKIQSLPGTAVGVEGVATQEPDQFNTPSVTDIVLVEVDAKRLAVPYWGNANPLAPPLPRGKKTLLEPSTGFTA